MKTIKINLQRDEVTFQNENKTIYNVRKPEGQPTGFSNAFNITIEGKQAETIESMFDIEANIYAYPDARAKSGYRFVQY